jgi:hypothetical protein
VVEREAGQPYAVDVQSQLERPSGRDRAPLELGAHPFIILAQAQGDAAAPAGAVRAHDRRPTAPAADVVAKSSLRDQVKVGADGGHCPVAGAGAVPGVQGGLGVEAVCLGEALAPAGEAAVPGRSRRISLPA